MNLAKSGNLMSAVLAVALSASAYGASPQLETSKAASRQCAAASKALGKVERALAATESSIAQASTLLDSCGSPPMCDGYNQQLRMLTTRKSNLQRAADLRQADVDRRCVDLPAGSAK